MCKCSEDFEILLAALAIGERPNELNSATKKLLANLVEESNAVLVAFPAFGAGAISQVRWLLGEKDAIRMDDSPRAKAIAEIKAKAECGCAPKPSPALEANLHCMISGALTQATESTGAEGMCAVEEMMTRAKRIAAQRKFLSGLYDIYVNAARASGLPNNLLPSAISISERAGQDGENGGGRPTAP